jgi:hypothetical protein
MKSNKNAVRGVGRPESKVVWPKGRFTREQAYALNGCGTEGRPCKLTVINHINEEIYRVDKKTGKIDRSRLNPNGAIVKVKGEFGKPTSEAGLGRKPEIYMRRSVFEATRKNAANLKKAKTSDVTVPMADAPSAPVTVDPTPAVSLDATPAPIETPVAVESAPAPVTIS